MIWSNALLLCLVFIWASGDPEPNVNVKINVNVNGESEEARESAISCNIVWNYEEYRPLIMIRANKEIVPPIKDTRISSNPDRIPFGTKLIFACPGHQNEFINANGTHTKLHGECVVEDQFKVCVNGYSEIFELNQLSCSSQLFPSFIKKDNGTSDKSCDGQGGEIYKTGYTYGDYHEFKDLEIEVCFDAKSQNSLCTSPNINGNETDYTRRAGRVLVIQWERKVGWHYGSPPCTRGPRRPTRECQAACENDDACFGYNEYTRSSRCELVYCPIGQLPIPGSFFVIAWTLEQGVSECKSLPDV